MSKLKRKLKKMLGYSLTVKHGIIGCQTIATMV